MTLQDVETEERVRATDCDEISAWVLPLLLCPQCRAAGLENHGRWLECGVCKARHRLQNGIAYMTDPEQMPAIEAQQKTWSIVEQLRGRYDLPLEAVLACPEEPDIRAQVEWLRTQLRDRGRCRILELGAGRGWASRLLAEDGHQVVATDLLDDPQIGLGCAVRQRIHSGLDFGCVQTGAESLPFCAEAFDCVFCIATLRHVVDLERVLQEAARVLRPGGVFLALHEPFRGKFTTQAQRFQDCFTYLLARWWLVGELPGTPRPEILHIRNNLGSTFFEICRRAAYCQALGEGAGLRTTVLPVAVALTRSLALTHKPEAQAKDDASHALQASVSVPNACNFMEPAWLDASVAAYNLDSGRLRTWLELARRHGQSDVVFELLAHWINVGNIQGVVLAQKDEKGATLRPAPCLEDPRHLDQELLACSAHGFIPIYGFYSPEGAKQHPYFWLQPEAGFLIPEAEMLEMTITCPANPYCIAPVRLELRINAERQPHYVVVILPGKTISIRVPLPPTAEGQPSLLVRLTANLGFIPSDFHPGHSNDSRLLCLQVKELRA